MGRSQSLNAFLYFDGSNYAFWKDSVKNGYVRPTTAKSEWDKAAFALANANSKAITAIFCGASTDEFHRISHIKTTKEVWTILETTYKGTKKVKDTKLQMLTTWFEEVKMSDDESFDSFYRRLNEIVIAKLNLGEKIEDAKVVRKILRFLPESFWAKQLSDSSNEDNVEKDLAFLAKNFRKFLKIKNNGKLSSKGKFSSSKNDKREFKKKDGKDYPSTQGIVCYECNSHGHFKKECPNYLRGKGKVFATTLSDLESSNSDVEGKCDSEGNYSVFMAIIAVNSRDDLSDLVDELGVHFEGEEVEESEDEDVCLNEGEKNLQEVYDALLEDCGKYDKVAKNAFLELEIIQANVKVERISNKKLDSVLSSQKSSNDKTGLGYTGEGSSSSGPKKEVKFVSAKNVEKPIVEKPKIETSVVAKRNIGTKPKEKGKSLPKSQRRPQVKHFYHHCGVRGHTRPNCFKLQALKRADSLHGQDNSRRMPKGI
ncbi:uncharacterized protein LOC126696202 [Quercus robur]|uniref:uncharacterized protein LOC126696202 n=1 Tax=Quercus robur TaxID=38942 RepID=UPI0021638EC8|nr:uncharacterized protein LOC126696202 [Quercus robur]